MARATQTRLPSLRRRDLSPKYRRHIPGQVSDWPPRGRMSIPGPIPVAMGAPSKPVRFRGRGPIYQSGGGR